MLVLKFSKLRQAPMKTLMRINSPFVRFLIGYVGLHRVVQSILICEFDWDESKSNYLSGLFAGLGYLFGSDYNVFSMAVSTLAQLVFQKFNTMNLQGKWKTLQELLKKVPLQAIVFALSFAWIGHASFFYPYSVPKVGRSMVHLTSGKM